jgi:1,4-dihydroxy-2-naphthoyl-CoA hydrolase
VNTPAPQPPAGAGSIWWQERLPDLDLMNRLGAGSIQAGLGIEFTEVGDDWLSGRMPVDARTHQPWGRLHGGASVVLAETLGTLGAVFTLDQERFIAVGMEINANHVRPVISGWVTGTARPETRGRTTQIWSIRITDEAGRLVCISRFTAAVIPIERN